MFKKLSLQAFMLTALFCCSVKVSYAAHSVDYVALYQAYVSQLADAVAKGDLPQAEELSKRYPSAIPGIRVGADDTLLHIAAKNGHLCMFSFLIEKGTPVDALNTVGSTALCVALEHKHFAIARHLLEQHGANAQMGAPLSRAVRQYLLLKKSSDPAKAQVVKEILVMLIQHGADVNEGLGFSGETPLFQAVTQSDRVLAELLLKHGAGVDERIVDATCLHYAADLGKLEMMELLVAHGADKGALDREGRTPLHCAARKGCLRAITLLIMLGSTIDARSWWYGVMPLMDAAEQGHDEVVKALLTCHANVNARNQHGKSALDYALDNCAPRGSMLNASRSREFRRTIATLLSYGATIDTFSSRSNNLIIAVALRNLPIIRHLINHRVVDVSAAADAQLLTVFPNYNWRNEQLQTLLRGWISEDEELPEVPNVVYHLSFMMYR